MKSAVTVSEQLLGKGFADGLRQEDLRIGKDVYTRTELIDQLGCGNFQAARNLTKVLRRLNISRLQSLYDLGPMPLARIAGVGEATLYVAMCLLDFGGYNVETWWGWNEDQHVKLSALKHRAIRKAKKGGAHAA